MAGYKDESSKINKKGGAIGSAFLRVQQMKHQSQVAVDLRNLRVNTNLNN